MDKQAYIKPALEVEEIALMQMMASSFGDPEAASADDVVGAQGHRGAWGNLWGGRGRRGTWGNLWVSED